MVLSRGRAKRRARAKLHRTLTASQWKAILIFWGRCAYCGTRERPLTRDCVVALRHGGAYVAANIVPACQWCNSSKGGRRVGVWMQQKGFDIEAFTKTWEEWRGLVIGR